MKTPKVSIVIPTYQCEGTILETLNSVIEQKFKDFEIIIIDHESTDQTISIAKSVIEKYPAIKIVSEPDTGVYDAMNKGVRMAAGEWVYFLGSGDKFISRDVLSHLQTSCFDGNADMVYGDVILKSDGSRYAGPFDMFRLQVKQNICHQAIFYRRSIFEKVGYFNLSYKMWADWDFNIRCFRHTELRNQYTDFVVSLYDDTTGVSIERDPVFYQEVPLCYIEQNDKYREQIDDCHRQIDEGNRQIQEYKEQIRQILGSRTYVFGDTILRPIRTCLGILRRISGRS